MKTKYTVCIGIKAKNALDHFRLNNNLGRFPLSRLVHSDYTDFRQRGARDANTFSLRQRPVTVQTNLTDDQILELLKLVDTTDIVTKHDTTDSMMVSHIIGTFLDAAIMGDLIDTNVLRDFLLDQGVDNLSELHKSGPIRVSSGAEASRLNLRKAASIGVTA